MATRIALTMLATTLLAPSVAFALDDQTVLARSAEAQVTVGDVGAFITNIQSEKGISEMPDLKTLRVIAERLLVQRTLAQQATLEGLDQSPEMQRRLRLERESMLAEARLEHLAAAATEPDYEQLAREKYLANKNDFMHPESVHAAHILVSPANRSECEAETIANDLRSQALADPDSFGALAEQHSDDKVSAKRGGDLGWFSIEKVAPAFGAAAFALESPGEISPVVKTQFGYHVIRLEGRRPPEQIPYDEVKGGLIEQEKAMFNRSMRRDFQQAILDDSGFTLDEALLEEYTNALHTEPRSNP